MVAEQTEFKFQKKTKNDPWKEYGGMPEYNNIKQADPVVTATFKFKTFEDFEEFKKLIKKHIYNGVKPFDGMQKKDKKNAWFPHKEKASKYLYVDEVEE